MPLYEYQCDACAHRFEVIQKFSDAPIETCPKCGGAVKKLLSSPAIQFKGSGWYITDYARAGKSDSANVASGTNESGGSSGGSKPETKGETKSEAKKESTPSPSTSASS
ncbi:MAG: zinc ribbon domain-containing protein [Acidobacteria bacterium]|nr:zinc ribbon domain-containing protein [Acidobacteriota bacterium]